MRTFLDLPVEEPADPAPAEEGIEPGDVAVDLDDERGRRSRVLRDDQRTTRAPDEKTAANREPALRPVAVDARLRRAEREQRHVPCEHEIDADRCCAGLDEASCRPTDLGEVLRPQSPRSGVGVVDSGVTARDRLFCGYAHLHDGTVVAQTMDTNVEEQ